MDNNSQPNPGKSPTDWQMAAPLQQTEATATGTGPSLQQLAGIAQDEVTVPPEPPRSRKPIIFLLVALFLLFVGIVGYVIFDSSNNNSNSAEIAQTQLVTENEQGISFKHPAQWQRFTTDQADIVFTEGGKDLDEADQGLLISLEELGSDYSSLSTQQKDSLEAAFREQFSESSSLENGGCSDVTNVETQKVNRLGYDVAFQVDATCGVVEGKNDTAKIRLLAAIKGKNFHVAALVALTATWESSSSSLEEIFSSIMPSESE